MHFIGNKQNKKTVKSFNIPPPLYLLMRAKSITDTDTDTPSHTTVTATVNSS